MTENGQEYTTMENEITRLVKDEINNMIADGSLKRIVLDEIKRQLPKSTGP